MSKRKAKDKPLHGNKRDNEIVGTEGNDKIEGRGGDDSISGLAGNDKLWGDKAGSGSGKGSKGSGSGKGSHKGSGKGSHKGSKGSGSGGDDYLDGGAGNDKVWGGAGDDEAAYNVAENDGARDKYDGGRGFDTLVLMLTEEEFQDEAIKDDLVAYLAILDDDSNHKKKYQFQAFDLKVQNFEELAFGTEAVAVIDDELGIGGPWMRLGGVYKYTADVLDNDIGVKDDGDLVDGLEILVIEDSIPASIDSIEWDDTDLVFNVFVLANGDGDAVIDLFEDDLKGDELDDGNDPAGVSFAYKALLDGVLIDTATVTLIG